MRKVCVVSNYNYDKYLSMCLDSLVGQSTRFDVVYVVDDGSTDKSRAIISKYAERYQEIVPLLKENNGQLSCFNYVCEFLDEDDLIWLIDSDDYYPPDYVELFLKESRGSKSDFFYCNTLQFKSNGMAPRTSHLGGTQNVDIGLSAQITRLTGIWVGSPTSGIVVTGRFFRDVLPYPYEEEWKVRADDILVFASALGGYSKTFLPSLAVGYRVHGKNNWFGVVYDYEYETKRKENLKILFDWYSEQYDLAEEISFFSLIREYNSISSPNYRKTMNIPIMKLLRRNFKRKVYLVFKRIVNS